MSGSVRYGFWVGNVQGVTFGDMTVRDMHDHAFIFNAGCEFGRLLGKSAAQVQAAP